MTYKIDPIVELISSPVTLVMPNGDEKRFTSGRLASTAVFKQRYVIDNITWLLLTLLKHRHLLEKVHSFNGDGRKYGEANN